MLQYKMQAIEKDLFDLFLEFGEKIEYMNSINAPKPDIRRVELEKNRIKYILCNNFGYAVYGDTIIKSTTYGKTDYQLMIVAKIADSYKENGF